VAHVQSWKMTLFALKWLSIIVCKDFGLPFAAFASICQSLVLSHPYGLFQFRHFQQA
jgi:hypothetical protein